MQIKDSVFIITGGASGLGAGTGRMLVEQGAKVVLADLNEAAGNALAAELGANAASCRPTLPTSQCQGLCRGGAGRFRRLAWTGQLRRHRAGREGAGEATARIRWTCSPEP
jgi:NAD(P)-dependent dehydrogenase (short-subunit alcohol dehydrogenase family)